MSALFTTVNAAADRVAMHGVRRALLEAQAASARLPLHIIDLPWPCTNEDYERIMSKFLDDARAAGVTQMAFGDLFLENIRRYRERNLEGTGITPIFPVWGLETNGLARDMIEAGLEAILSCVDLAKLDRSFAGKAFDAELLAALPEGTDPCGENGEFHSFVTAGPMLARPLKIDVGDVVERDGFAFADLVQTAVAR